jgi:lipopolysaccharide transport system permease protein
MRDAWRITDNFLRKLVLQRNLLQNLVVRDLKSRYVGSLMGFFWAVIHPLALLFTYTFVFSVVLKQKALVKSGTESFALFLFCGILPWLLFQDTVTRSANTVMDYSNLVKKTKFPVEIVPLSIFLANMVAHLIGLMILVVALAVTQSLSWWMLLLPLIWVTLFLFSVGLGWLVATLQVFLRDTAQILQVVMTLWFWFTPIFYTIDMLPKPLRMLAGMNPLSTVVDGYRACLLQGKSPDPYALLMGISVSLAVFTIGGIAFRVGKREFCDVL